MIKKNIKYKIYNIYLKSNIIHKMIDLQSKAKQDKFLSVYAPFNPL